MCGDMVIFQSLSQGKGNRPTDEGFNAQMMVTVQSYRLTSVQIYSQTSRDFIMGIMHM